MSDFPLSAAQRRAVESEWADACVTAGAGSGKTRVLAERFAHLVRRYDLPVRSVAGLTFTEKAASGLRERVAGIFDNGTEEERRADVEFAPILTLHAFFSLLLRLHAVEAGLDPAFTVLEAREAALLRDEALLAVANQLAEEEPANAQALELLSGDAQAVLGALFERLRGSGVTPDQWRFVAAQGDPAALLAPCEPGIEALEAQGAGFEPAQQRLLAHALRTAREACAWLRQGPVLAALPLLRAGDLIAGLTLSRARPFTTARNGLRDALRAAGALCLDAWTQANLDVPIRRFLTLLESIYGARKRELGALDFADLELEALKLLAACEARGELPDLLPRALLVDEYQDTNPLQARILGILRKTATHFSVGDPKQSIYRFRRADVRVIVAEAERVGATGRFQLSESYRAHPNLVAAINALARPLFDAGRAGVPYEDLVAKGTFVPASGALMELAFVDGGKGTRLEHVRVEEAEWIAERIQALTDGRVPRLAGSAGGRPLHAGDVAILVRARASMPALEDALARRAIAFVTHGGSGFFGAEEIVDLLHILRVLHDREDRYALAAVLSGPLYVADEATLSRWFGPDSTLTPYERIQHDAREHPRLQRLLDGLEHLREEAVLGSQVRTVRGVLDELGLLEVCLLLRSGERRAANLRKALGVAQALDAAGRRGLGELVRQLDALRAEEAREAQAPAGGVDAKAVQLLTVHAAKGLEYPVVFLADTGRKSGSRPDPVLHDGAGGVAVCGSDPVEGTRLVPAGYSLLDDQESEAEAQESLRLLYVAMTRAQERLIVSSSCAGFTNKGQPCYATHWAREFWDLLELDAAGACQDYERDGAALCIHRVQRQCTPRAAAGLPEPPGEVPLEVRAAAQELFAVAARPTALLGNTRFVVSVSELLVFAQSPARYYEERVLLGGDAQRASPAAAQTQADLESGVDASGGQELGAAGRERALRWDEPVQAGSGVDRAAMGRAVHALIERVQAQDPAPTPIAIREALAAELSGAEPGEGDCQLAAQMMERFAQSATGAALLAALRTGQAVERELAFHAAIRFPEGAEVGGLEALLVKGSIDLWLPQAEGIWIVDHKTNALSRGNRTPQDLGTYYQWQLRLYALAAERILGQDVAGARLLLLDPSWGPSAVEVPIDVGGEALAETRRLCQAFARAELEGRYPTDWRLLLTE